MATLVERQYYGNYGNGNCYVDAYGYTSCNSAWNSWIRWLVLGLVIIGALLIFFLFSCISARRRRRLGYSPYRGTGWTLGRTPPGHAPAEYNAQPYYNNSNNPPPAYPQNETGYTRGNDVELQQPQATYYGGYRSGESAFEPPKGPPPGRGDGIIR